MEATETPVLFLIFNRPKPTRRVFDAIRRARPRRLYIAADGPRGDRAGEAELCTAARDVVSGVDWRCEVKTLFRHSNLGCKRAVSSAISWFFGEVEEGIILEDDCLPADSFFAFCTDLLARYRNDERIMVISGDHLFGDMRFGDASYYFTRVPHIWGWATWRRVWNLYDVEMQLLPEFLERDAIAGVFHDTCVRRRFQHALQKAYRGDIDTWDYQLCFCIWSNNGLCINPQINLVTNIGHDGSATHTSSRKDTPWADLPLGEITKIIHPRLITYEPRADLALVKAELRAQPFLVRRWRRLEKRVWGRMVAVTRTPAHGSGS